MTQQFEAPASSVKMPEVDYFYWPAIMGERYPPTFSNAGHYSYTSSGEYACIARNSSLAGAMSIQWPALSRYRPGSDRGGARMSCRLYVGGVGSGTPITDLDMCASAMGPRFQISWNVLGTCTIYGGAASGGGSFAELYSGPYGKWLELVAEIDPNTPENGSLSITGYGSMSYAGAASTAHVAIRPYLFDLASATGLLAITQMRVDYTD